MTPIRFFCCVFLPFGLAHFLSVLLRMVGGVSAPHMMARFGIGPEQLGWLSGAYFLGFALAQLPVGLALDRHGPRRVQLLLLPVAALACWWFGAAQQVAGLLASRLLLGFALGGCFMSAIKATATWSTRGRLATVNGWLIAAGGMGGAAATLPVQLLLDFAGWHGLFNCLAASLAAAAMLVGWLAPREAHLPRQPPAHGLRACLAQPGTLRILSLLAIPHMCYFGLQGLWIGRWLQAGGGLSEPEVAWQLYLCMVGGVFGAIGMGLVTDRLEQRGWRVLDFAAGGLALFILVQLALAAGWAASLPALAVSFSVAGAVTGLEYTLVARAVPQGMAGRASTLLNLLVFGGAFAVQALAGLLAARHLGAVFALAALAQLPGLCAYVLWRRRAASSALDSRSTRVASSPSLMVKGGASRT